MNLATDIACLCNLWQCAPSAASFLLGADLCALVVQCPACGHVRARDGGSLAFCDAVCEWKFENGWEGRQVVRRERAMDYKICPPLPEHISYEMETATATMQSWQRPAWKARGF